MIFDEKKGLATFLQDKSSQNLTRHKKNCFFFGGLKQESYF